MQLLLKVISFRQAMLYRSNRSSGYKEYDTGRTYMAKMGDWRQNKDEEVQLDGIGGVNIVVKADVHRSGMVKNHLNPGRLLTNLQELISLAMRSKTKQKRKALQKWRREQATRSLDYRTMSCGI
jgi:hypothetical protein